MSKNDIPATIDPLIEKFAALATSTIGNALDELGIEGIIGNLKAFVPGRPFCGFAVTVREVTGAFGEYDVSDFRVGAIIDAAGPGDVIVVANDGAQVSTWGGLASFAAKQKGIAGTVIDGGARDIEEIREHGYAVHARHLLPTGGRKRIRVEAINIPIVVDGIDVKPGDIVRADETGIVCVPANGAEEVLELALRYDANDKEALQIRGRPYMQSPWIRGLLARRPTNVVLVAMANKTARIVWAMLRDQRNFDPAQAR